jgi:hypothetical protein
VDLLVVGLHRQECLCHKKREEFTTEVAEESRESGGWGIEKRKEKIEKREEKTPAP